MPELKIQNEKPLQALLLVAAAPVYWSLWLLHGDALLEMARSQSWVALSQVLAIGVGPLVCLKAVLSLSSALISPGWKARLVHLHWKDPLPGSRADNLLLKDDRIDHKRLPRQVAELLDKSLTPQERNARWYNNIFRVVRMDPAVSNTHRQYLLHRDAASGVFVVFLLTGICDLIGRLAFGIPIIVGLTYLIVIGYLLVLICIADQAGKRMVTGAIANFPDTNPEGDGDDSDY